MDKIEKRLIGMCVGLVMGGGVGAIFMAIMNIMRYYPFLVQQETLRLHTILFMLTGIVAVIGGLLMFKKWQIFQNS